MTTRKEQEYLLQESALRQLQRGKIDRRQFLQRTVMTGLGLAGVSALARGGAIGSALAQDRPLTPTFYQWIEDLHPGIPTVNGAFILIPAWKFELAAKGCAASAGNSVKKPLL